MESKFRVGDHVKIHSRFGGCYNNKTGTIISTDVLICYSPMPDFCRIRLDSPAVGIGGREIKEDIFEYTELELLRSGEKYDN